MEKLLKKHADKLRFGIVGTITTIIDYFILFALVTMGFPALASNYISTFAAMVFSFIANKKYTFKNDGKNHGNQIMRFLIVTLFGIWALQPLLIEGTRLSLGFLALEPRIILLIGKVLASGASMVWNYIMFSKFVFKKKSNN